MKIRPFGHKFHAAR